MSERDLRDLLDDLAGVPAPPSRIAADETYARGRRRWRRRRSVHAAVAVALTAVALGGIGVAAAQSRSPGGPVGSPGGSTSAPASGILQWASAADAHHLYLGFHACGGTRCEKTTVRLVGSDDGGRTWTDRNPAVSILGLAVLGPDVLVSRGPTLSTDPSLSTDGGRTWRPARRTAETTPAVAAGAGLLCWADGDAECQLHVLDPATGRFARLATQPPLRLFTFGVVDVVGGVAWVAGTDPTSGRPAVASSADGGRTWSPHTFAEPARALADVTTADGRTAYVVIHDSAGRRRSVYAGHPGGKWRWIEAAKKVPDAEHGSPASFVLADGRHVLGQLVSRRPDLDRVRFWVATDGLYRPAAFDGLPDTVYQVRRTPGGWYFTRGYGDSGGLYGSTDGRNWAPIPYP